MKGGSRKPKLFGPGFARTRTSESKKCDIIDDDYGNQFANSQGSRDLRGRPDANGGLAQTKSARAGDFKTMNLVIVIGSAQMFFRNFGLRHVNAALALAIGLAAPNAGQKIIAGFARPVEWLRSRLRPQVPEKSIQVQIQRPLSSERRGQLSADNRLLCRPPDIAARDRIRRCRRLSLRRSGS